MDSVFEIGVGLSVSGAIVSFGMVLVLLMWQCIITINDLSQLVAEKPKTLALILWIVTLVSNFLFLTLLNIPYWSSASPFGMYDLPLQDWLVHDQFGALLLVSSFVGASLAFAATVALTRRRYLI